MIGKGAAAGIGLAVLILTWFGPAEAFPRMRMSEKDEGGSDVNLIVREIRVTPVRARVGDPVRIEMVVESRSEGYGTTTARVYANGREIAGHLYTYGVGGEGGRITRETFTWDTKGAKPGAYAIRGEVFLWEDSSPFDNDLKAPEPVVLLPAGSTEATGGTTMARDPRYHPRPTAPGKEATGNY